MRPLLVLGLFVVSALASPFEQALLTRRERAFFGLIKEDTEADLDTDGAIKRWEYPAERHTVTTEDGYILTIFRIPHGRNVSATPTEPRPVVLIQHGLLGSSDMWVNNLPHQDAAFIYADKGYDVWIGNFRGNKYGRKHTTLSADKDKMKFFDFSWPEMAKYDIPAMVNYILKTSNAPTLYYIGHSMGTLTAFAQFSQDREFAKKIKKFYALAPVMKVANLQGAMSVVAMFTGTIDNTLYYTGMEEFFPPMWLTKQFGQYVCGSMKLVGDMVCGNALMMIAGPSSNQLNATRLPVYLAHTPAGTSRRTFVHFGQMANSGRMCQYDFGSSKNKERYGQEIPPEYDVSQMETPVGLYWGSTDWLADDKDVRNMSPKLKNVFTREYLDDFNHMDFLWGLRAAKEVYIPIQNDIAADFGSAQ
jgi:lysosomal acid lipase/cholesteryl ester hydrolase